MAYWPFPSFLGPLSPLAVKGSAFDMEMIFHSYANKTHFCALDVILKVRVFETWKWPIARLRRRRGQVAYYGSAAENSALHIFNFKLFAFINK